MKVIRAKTAGFCMGVSLALQKLDQALEQNKDKRICTLGPIIHNPQVLEEYADLGVQCLHSVDEVQKHDIVVVRAHGIPQQEEKALLAKAFTIIDATCPKVKKAQNAIANATKKVAEQKPSLLLFGEEDHPEVRGLISYAQGAAFVFDSLEKLQSFSLTSQGTYVLASQTTQDGKIFRDIEDYLRHNYPGIPVLSTICHATHQRQEDIMNIASHVDAVVVVGGKQSGNTCRLADVATAQGKPTWHIETADELKKENFSTFSQIGLTAGASTPKRLIDTTHKLLESF